MDYNFACPTLHRLYYNGYWLMLVSYKKYRRSILKSCYYIIFNSSSVLFQLLLYGHVVESIKYSKKLDNWPCINNNECLKSSDKRYKHFIEIS